MAELTVYVVAFLAFYIGVLLWMGQRAAKHSKTLEGYALGGRWLSSLAWGLSGFATWGSASAYMGVPALMYTFGWSFWWLPMATTITPVIAIILFTGRMRKQGEKLGALTTQDYISFRYGGGICGEILRLLISIILMIITVGWMIAQFKGSGTLFKYIVGGPFEFGVLISAIVILIYVVVGGMLAAALTDVFQAAFMILISIALVPVVLGAVGGFEGMSAGLAKIDPGLAQPFYKWWTPLFAVCLFPYWFGFYASMPFYNNKWLALRGGKGYWREVLEFAIGFQAGQTFEIILWWCGGAARAMGITATPPYGADMVIPELIVRFLHPALVVVGLVAILAAIMSTVDHVVHAAGLALGNDIYRRIIRRAKQDDAKVISNALLISRIMVFVFVVIGAAWTFISPPPLLSLLMYYVAGWMMSALLVPMGMGLWYKEATPQAALASALAGLIGFTWCSTPGVGPGLGYAVDGSFGILSSLIAFLVVQFIVLKLKGERAIPKVATEIFE
jgi:Na+/proline symporter